MIVCWGFQKSAIEGGRLVVQSVIFFGKSLIGLGKSFSLKFSFSKWCFYQLNWSRFWWNLFWNGDDLNVFATEHQTYVAVS